VTNIDDVRERFSATADQVAEHAARHIETVRKELRSLIDFNGNERALDAGTGAGTLALALAPLVAEVVGVDVVPELLEAARRQAPENVSFVEGNIASLDLDSFSFDVACTRRTLHHVPRPELVVAELVRVTRRGGTVIVEDQIAPVDPLSALELDRFERARDPSHTRTLPDIDLRHLFEANGLVLVKSRVRHERRPLDAYLDLAGCTGDKREQVRAMSPGGPDHYVAEAAWYVLRKAG
jgi:ubiquinone/menaquinone biosynthesis C-methylase UbiE